MTNEKEGKKAKKKYEKPVLRVVNISPGVQTLGTGCKLISHTLGIGNNPCTPGSPCVTNQGS